MAIELFILFFLLPTFFYAGRLRVPALAALWVLTGYCLFVLWRTGHLREAAPVPLRFGPSLLPIAGLFLAFAAATTIAVYRYTPDDLFRFVRRRPKLWALVVVTYPVLSVYPQAIVFRVFVFERYRLLLQTTWILVLFSAAAFAYMHIVYRNWIAVAIAGLGGLLFAMRYAQTGSLFVSWFEHSLYGCWLFTVGLGRWFFYREQLRRLARPAH